MTPIERLVLAEVNYQQACQYAKHHVHCAGTKETPLADVLYAFLELELAKEEVRRANTHK